MAKKVTKKVRVSNMFFYCETEHKALIYILPLHVYKHFSQLCNQIHPLFVPLHYETFLHNDPIMDHTEILRD